MAKRSVGDKINVHRFGYERADGNSDDRTSTISYGRGDNKKTIDLSVVVISEMEVEEVDADGNPTKLKQTKKETAVIYDCETYTIKGNRTTGDREFKRAVSQENIDNGKCKKIASKTKHPKGHDDYNEETNNRWIFEDDVDVPEVFKDELLAGGATTASKSLAEIEDKNLKGSSKTQQDELNSDDPEVKAAAEELNRKGALDDGSEVATSNGLNALRNIEKERRDGRYTSSGGIRFPADLNSKDQAKKQDYIIFRIYEYSPKKLSSTNPDQIGLGDTRVTEIGEGRSEKGTIILPIPGNIQDSNGVEWAKGDINPLQAELASAALGLISGGENPQGVTDRFVEKVRSSSVLGDARTVTANFFAARATRTKGLLSRATGSIINPNSELLFKGPKLRTFNFSYELSARNDKDAKAIVSIIRAFKQASSVQKSKTRIFLGAPCTFTIKYMNAKDQEHKFIGKIKECALTNIAVNYAPAQYSTYDDGYMTKYNLTLQFQELEPIHNSDYNDKDFDTTNNAGSIGY